jgi:CBS domain-containing protein
MSAGRICIREVDTAEVTESVQVAADRMKSRNVGTLVVLDPLRRPLGILTDRDLAIRVVARGKDAFTTTVGDVMTHSPRCVLESTPIEEAVSLMRRGPYRRLPVIDHSDRLIGLLSIDDVIDLLAEEFHEMGTLFKAERPESIAEPTPARFE